MVNPRDIAGERTKKKKKKKKNLPFYSIFADLDFVKGSHGRRKAEPIGYSFLHHFQLIRMKVYQMLKKCNVLLKQLKLNILILLLSDVHWNKGKDFCSTDNAKKR